MPDPTAPPLRALSSLVAYGPVAVALGRFLAVGCAGLAVDIAAFHGLAGLGLSYPVARALSLLLATGVTWRLNRRFTFGPSVRPAPAEAGRYALVALLAQGLNWGLFVGSCRALPEAPVLVLLVGCAACATVLSFAGQRLVTFSRGTR